MSIINKIPTDQTNYLQMMAPIADLPKSLYLLGNLPGERLPSVAIVGTRRPTAYGREIAYRLSYELASKGVVIISGLALGIDSIAHQAALDAGGRTIAVLPGGLDRVYPASHSQLARRIVEKGNALVSEYPVGTQIFPVNFIARNRIVAGLSDGLLVIEAAIKSGTIHTVGFALEYGRSVMAVPGNITSPMSDGCNNIIKQGACAVTSISDILNEIGISTYKKVQTRLPLGDNPQEAALIKLIYAGIKDGDDLYIKSGLSAAEYSQTMTMLEINGKIRAYGGNVWGLT
jgi:DNA processing protein